MSALLFHHTCHGGERNKCRNKEEEHGKHLGDRIYLIRISAVAVEAHVVAAIGDVPRRLTDIGKLSLGVLYRFFRLRKLALCVELCGFIAPLGIGELVFLIIQAVLSRCKLCTRRLYRRFALFKLCVSRVKRCFLLGFGFIYRRHCRRKERRISGILAFCVCTRSGYSARDRIISGVKLRASRTYLFSLGVELGH